MNVIITGASQGIGKSMAFYFASKGASLGLCARNFEKLKVIKQEIEKEYEVDVYIEQVDVTNLDDATQFIKNVTDKLAPIDVLINNAGSFVIGNCSDEPYANLQKMLDVNVLSAYYFSKLLIPHFKLYNKGHIMFVGSVAGLQAYQNGGSYSIAKHALHGLAANLRLELKTHNIKVSNIVPGATYTASWDGSGVAKERIMESEDIAKVAYMLTQLSSQACPELLVMRPQLGDL